MPRRESRYREHPACTNCSGAGRRCSRGEPVCDPCNEKGLQCEYPPRQYSCFRCEKVKEKCDKQRPCGRCARLDYECVYGDEATASPSPSAGPPLQSTSSSAVPQPTSLPVGLPPTVPSIPPPLPLADDARPSAVPQPTGLPVRLPPTVPSISQPLRSTNNPPHPALPRASSSSGLYHALGPPGSIAPPPPPRYVDNEAQRNWEIRTDRELQRLRNENRALREMELQRLRDENRALREMEMERLREENRALRERLGIRPYVPARPRTERPSSTGYNEPELRRPGSGPSTGFYDALGLPGSSTAPRRAERSVSSRSLGLRRSWDEVQDQEGESGEERDTDKHVDKVSQGKSESESNGSTEEGGKEQKGKEQKTGQDEDDEEEEEDYAAEFDNWRNMFDFPDDEEEDPNYDPNNKDDDPGRHVIPSIEIRRPKKSKRR